VFYISLTFVTLSMLIVGGVGSLSGAVLGVLMVTLIVEALRVLEGGVSVGPISMQLPKGFQEIGLGVMMALILIFRPSGLTRGREIPLPWRRRGPSPQSFAAAAMARSSGTSLDAPMARNRDHCRR
jgi:branched-chain amino acid transport system permease protein